MFRGAGSDEVFRVTRVGLTAEAAAPTAGGRIHAAERAGVGQTGGAKDRLPRDAGGRGREPREGREENTGGQAQASDGRVASLCSK